MSGNFIISPLGAKLNKDHDTWSKQDPYCVVTVGSTKKKTKAHGGGGKNPKWNNYTWTFPKTGNQDIKVEVYDEDTGADTQIGVGALRVRDIGTQDQIINVPVKYKGKDAGYVQMRVRFQPHQPSQSGSRP